MQKAHFLRIHSRRQWLAFGIAALAITLLLPLLNGLDSASPLHAPDYVVSTAGKFLCYAIVAIALDLIWGYTGILSLGHGVFFAFGGYAMGMYMMLDIAGEGVYRSKLPDFMVFLDWQELPWFWRASDNFFVSLGLALLVPSLVAFVFGYLAFRSRIRGVYFAIITQAMTFALMLLFFRNDTGLGGNNGLTDFKRIYGYSLHDPDTKVGLYVASALALVAAYLVCRFIVTSKAGRVLRAIRDAEGRIVFSGYDPLRYKLFVWTLSAALCGLAGALYVPQVGIINPSEMQPANSIEMAIWVAVGGRATLVGAALGAIVVNLAKSYFTVGFPDYWLFVLGGLFIVVTLALPGGIFGFKRSGMPWLGRLPWLKRFA
jgi:urea transport system permease protein